MGSKLHGLPRKFYVGHTTTSTVDQSWVNYFYCNRITNYFQVIVIDSKLQLLSSNCNWPQITNYSISSITNSITFQLLFIKNCLYLIVVCREITPHLGYPPWGTPPCTVGWHKGISRQNGYNSVTRPQIGILRPLFTLQLLILPTRDPFHAQKS